MKTLEQLGFKRTVFKKDNGKEIIKFTLGATTIEFGVNKVYMGVPKQFITQELLEAIQLELNKSKVTEEVKQLIRLLPPEIKWVACGSGGDIYGYEKKPTKYNGVWGGDVVWSLSLFNHLLSPLITWNDTEPVNLDEWRALL